uniref:Reverse transcriptase/retrotransposon-derived protein RNase H-like domain-containing protein n=1 Tax=Fagus sylvatica TaxID=28930 RepID=A0A2N9EZT3_FAGSY
MVDTSRRASAVTSVGKSKVMGKIKQKVKRSRKLPWPPKLTPTKDNDHHSPALRWSLLILDMELRKNGLEQIYGLWAATMPPKRSTRQNSVANSHVEVQSQDLLKQERERPPKEPRHFVRKPPYPIELLKEPYLEKYDTPTFALFDGKRKGSAIEHISKFLDFMGPFTAHGELCLREFSKSLVDKAYLARKTAISVKPHVEKGRDKKSVSQTLTVSTAAASSSSKRKNSTEKVYEEPSPLPFTAEEMMAIFDKWVQDEVNRKIQDGTLQLSKEQQKVHKTPFPNYKKDKNKAVVLVVIHENVNDMEVEESAAASSSLVLAAVRNLQKSPKFKSLFNQLGFGPEARNAATEALITIAAESGAICFTAVAHASHVFLETTNAINFIDEDMEVQYPDHRPPLYLSAVMKDVQVRCALVDTSSCLNLIPLNTLQAANVPQQKIQGSPMEVTGFGGVTKYTMGHVQLVLRVGPIVALTRFHVVNAEAPYHVLLGRPWLHKHKLVSSTYHQCVKGRLNGKPIRIAVNFSPFDQTEAHFVEAALYDDLSSTGNPPIVKPCGTPLLDWEDIKDDPEVDLRELLERKKKRKEYVFAWDYDEMLGIDPGLVAHSLNVELGTRPVVQPMKTFHTEVEVQITQEVKKLLAAGFIKPIQHPRKEKIKKREDLETLRKVFDRCRLYKLKMNPLKCAFGVSAGKFLGFLVHNRGIDVDLAKASAIVTMKAPTSHKELKSFLGRLSYIRRFILGLAAVTAVFTPLMKKEVPFVWSMASQQVFEKIQAIMTKLPTVCTPVVGRPLRLYLASNGEAIGALIAQEDESGTEKPVYYVSQALRDAETSQVIADLLAQFLGEDGSSISHEVPRGMGEALLADLAKGEFLLKEPSLAPYRGLAQKLEEKFDTFKISHAMRCGNRYADALATLGSQISFEGLKVDVTINKRSTPIIDLLKEQFEEQYLDVEDWRTPIKAKLISPEGVADLKTLKGYVLIAGDLYCRLPGGVLDAADFVKSCHTCQLQANLIHTHPTSLQNMVTPWPFHTWGLDFIGPINPPFGGYIWILVATEYFSKWVEAIPLRKTTGAAVANFIREHIITRGWSFHLADALWAYRGLTKTVTGFTPFSLVYGTDAITPTKLLVPSPRILHGMDLETNADICAEARVADLEGLEEARELAQACSLRTVDHVRRGLPSPSMFALNWKGPYLICEAYDSGHYKLAMADGTTLADPINGKWLKRYYS